LLGEFNWYDKNGYLAASLYKPKRTLYQHIEIYKLAYGLDKIPKGYVIHHVNEDTQDNRVSNLQMMLRSEHISHHHTGKPKPANIERNKSEYMRNLSRGNTFGKGLAGDKNGRSIVTDHEWLEWLEGLEKLFSGQYKTQSSLAERLGINKTQVSFVIKGRSRKHLQHRILELKQLYGWE
jgi:hypothetical protein